MKISTENQKINDLLEKNYGLKLQHAERKSSF